eukprot:TRINITY_DN10314_c0_g2_i1.p2 TRINITY_DN10314_c0_g2~~TRINITY_DN10314_c0_g2_i1.p2  ORF type:complete len:133 (+),score=2.89 TRINITY_DN10314_c0_g2_i1:290-688(+)
MLTNSSAVISDCFSLLYLARLSLKNSVHCSFGVRGLSSVFSGHCEDSSDIFLLCFLLSFDNTSLCAFFILSFLSKLGGCLSISLRLFLCSSLGSLSLEVIGERYEESSDGLLSYELVCEITIFDYFHDFSYN